MTQDTTRRLTFRSRIPWRAQGAAFGMACSLALAVWGGVAPVSAAEPEAAGAGSIVTPQRVYAQQLHLQDQLQLGEGRFRGMSGAQRNQFAKRQRRVIDTVRDLSAFSDLRPDQRTVLFNDLQWINAAIRGTAGDEQVCEFTETVGSRIWHSVCMTADKAMQYERNAQEQLRKADATATSGSGSQL